jgi:phage terminase large subunit
VFKTGPLYLANLNATHDIIVDQGGTWSGKTYSILQVLFSLAISRAGAVVTIVGQDIPNLKRGALRDCQQIVSESPVLASLIESYNATDRIYKFKSGSVMEFVSYANEQDARAGKRDFLFVNEANGIPWPVFEQLVNRTRVRTFIDYNPSIPFWAHDRLIKPKRFGEKTVQLIISDHRHNPFLTKEQHDHIERRGQEDPEWGKVYARGKTGSVEGLIFRNWEWCDGIPDGAALVANGLDFGFTNDPTALPAVYKQNGELWIDLMIYETGLTNPAIAAKFKELKCSGEVVADSAEPKSIAELRNEGLFVTPANKGGDSVMKRYKMNITRRSVQAGNELNSYKWRVDKVSGQSINEPVDFNNHFIDALRYVALNKLSVNKSGEYHIS